MLAELGVQTLFIDPGSPWEHGFVESINGKLLGRELSQMLREAQIPVERLAARVQGPAPPQLVWQPATGAGGGALAEILIDRLVILR